MNKRFIRETILIIALALIMWFCLHSAVDRFLSGNLTAAEFDFICFLINYNIFKKAYNK